MNTENAIKLHVDAFCSDQPGGRGFERRLYTSADIKKIKQKNLQLNRFAATAMEGPCGG